MSTNVSENAGNADTRHDDEAGAREPYPVSLGDTSRRLLAAALRSIAEDLMLNVPSVPATSAFRHLSYEQGEKIKSQILGLQG